MSSPPRHLLKVWRFVRWLDRARWHSMEANLIPGPVFAALTRDEKVLTHWLGYITDQQRPYKDVWEQGGPIFAEIVRTYTRARGDAIDILKRFSHPGETADSVDRLTAKTQRSDGQRLSYAPRFGMHLLSIASTLAVLEAHKRSLAHYLGTHWAFCIGNAEDRADDPTHRVAFLLYLLTYGEVTRGSTSVRQPGFRHAVRRRTEGVSHTLSHPRVLLDEYRTWLTRPQRYHKRLWAAFRDYVRPGSAFRNHLLAAFQTAGRPDVVAFFRSHESEMLGSLEIPGDLWNLRFFERVFGANVDPASFRGWYEALRHEGRLPAGTYVEQFDVSFDYSPNMCAERAYDTWAALGNKGSMFTLRIAMMRTHECRTAAAAEVRRGVADAGRADAAHHGGQ